MDPRHPELAISRLRELMKQYDRIEKDMKEVTVPARLAQLEREGGLVVQEICLVAPRIHEAMMQTSRQRRHELSRGIVEKPVEKPVEKRRSEALAEIAKQTENISEQISEIADTVTEKVEKTTKKKTTKKKTAKKAE